MLAFEFLSNVTFPLLFVCLPFGAEMFSAVTEWLVVTFEARFGSLLLSVKEA